MTKEKISYLILKLAVAFPLLYGAWSEYLRPKYWGAFVPVSLTHFVSIGIILWIVSVLQVVVASWILFSHRPFAPALTTAIYLGLVVLFNARWGTVSFDIFYRDIAIALAALSLAVKSKTF